MTDIQKRVRHPVHSWMAAALDGVVAPTGSVFEAKFMLPWAFTEELASRSIGRSCSTTWVVAARSSVLSIITGGGKWVEITVHADPLYQHC
jgi:hypothetical protein